MAQDKKSFLLYSDLIHTVRKMPVDKAGELFLTILSYVNDENPVVNDIMIDLVFEPVKQQLKRDLQKFEITVMGRRKSGKLGGIKSGESRTSKQKEANASHSKQKEANEADNDNDNDNVNDNVSVKEFKAPTHTQVKEEFFKSRKSGWSDAKCTVEATNFFDHYESVGWMVNGHTLINWHARARKWINDERTNKVVEPSSNGIINLKSQPRK